MTFIYWKRYLIPIWFLRSNFSRFPEQLLKDLAPLETPGEYSKIDYSLGDAFGVCSVVFWSTFLRCSTRLQIHTLNNWTVKSVVPVFELGVRLSMTLHIVDLWQYFCMISQEVRLSSNTISRVLPLYFACQAAVILALFTTFDDGWWFMPSFGKILLTILSSRCPKASYSALGSSKLK